MCNESKKDSIIISSELHSEMNAERSTEGQTKIPPINTISGSGLSTNTLARKDKSFNNFIDFFIKLAKGKK